MATAKFAAAEAERSLAQLLFRSASQHEKLASMLPTGGEGTALLRDAATMRDQAERHISSAMQKEDEAAALRDHIMNSERSAADAVAAQQQQQQQAEGGGDDTMALVRAGVAGVAVALPTLTRGSLADRTTLDGGRNSAIILSDLP